MRGELCGEVCGERGHVRKNRNAGSDYHPGRLHAAPVGEFHLKALAVAREQLHVVLVNIGNSTLLEPAAVIEKYLERNRVLWRDARAFTVAAKAVPARRVGQAESAPR